MVHSPWPSLLCTSFQIYQIFVKHLPEDEMFLVDDSCILSEFVSGVVLTGKKC
jgi:hypothetical protein